MSTWRSNQTELIVPIHLKSLLGALRPSSEKHEGNRLFEIVLVESEDFETLIRLPSTALSPEEKTQTNLNKTKAAGNLRDSTAENP